MTKAKGWLSAVLIALLPLVLVACAGDAGMEEEYAGEGPGEETGADPETGEPGYEQYTYVGYGYDWDWGPNEDWDADADAQLTRTEWDEGFGTVYSGWDADADDRLTREELETASFDWWDVDDDGRVSREEWNRVAESWDLEGYEWPSWNEIDTDGDGYVGEEGDEDLFPQDAWADVWDVNEDGSVTRDEASETLWNRFDTDGDDAIDENEWNAWTG